jgi:serine/threonine protein kinase
MSLAPGTKIASYEVLASVGAGGMGEVYRARDAKLGRDVAVKILPDVLALDAVEGGSYEEHPGSDPLDGLGSVHRSGSGARRGPRGTSRQPT